MTHYVIEHPTRGVLVDFDGDQPHFSWAILRPSDKALRFGDRQAAGRYIGKLPPPIAADCYVVAFSNRTPVVLTGDVSHE